jgi:hypothetical protein
MLHEYHVMYSVQYYPRFHVAAVGLGTYTRRYGEAPVFSLTIIHTYEQYYYVTVIFYSELGPSSGHDSYTNGYIS